MSVEDRQTHEVITAERTDPYLQHVTEDGSVLADDDDSGPGLASELLVDTGVSRLVAVSLVSGTGEVLVSVE